MNAEYGRVTPAIATTIFMKKQELVSAELGAPLFTEYDHDGLMLDVFGIFDGKEFTVMDVAITGTRFSVLKLVEGCHHEQLKYSLLEAMTKWCYRQHEIEQENAALTAEQDKREFAREMQS